MWNSGSYYVHVHVHCTCTVEDKKNVSVYLSVERLYFNRSTDRTTVKTKTVNT